jgi:diguanylate cyclase (GGDEF)-like protein/PAS domain S-box-containing protein
MTHLANKAGSLSQFSSILHLIKIVFLIPLMAATTLAFATGKQASMPLATSSAKMVINQPTLTVGSELDFPPFATGSTDATAGGFSVELWRAIAAEAHFNYTIRVRPFHELLQEFKDGKIDVLINFSKSEQRQKYADFTVPLVTSRGAIFVRKGQRNIKSEADFSGKSIIVISADFGHEYAILQGWEKQLVLVNTAEKGLRLLASGKHDAMLLSKLSGMHTLRTTGLSNIEALSIPAGFSQKFSLAVHKGQADLLSQINDALAITKSNQTYHHIYERWFTVFEPKEVGFNELINYLLPIIALFIISLAYLYYLRLVERKREAESLLMMRFSVDHANDSVFWINRDGRILYVNIAACVERGYSESELLGMQISLLNPDYQLGEWGSHFDELSRRGSIATETLHRAKNGRIFPVEVNANYIKLRGEEINFAIVRDITERRATEVSLRIAAAAFESHEAIMVTDANSIILRVNRAFSNITGFSSEEAIGLTPRLLHSGKQNRAFYDAMWLSINTTGTWEGEAWNRRKSGEVYPVYLMVSAVKDNVGIITNYVSTQTDITLEKAAADAIKNLAFYDALTQLPNRRLLLDRLGQALAASARNGRRGALLFLDLDHFKILNDTHGHDTGDALLREVALRLSLCVRKVDLVARLGGDEFVVLLEMLSSDDFEAATQTEIAGAKILESLNKVYQLDGNDHHNSSSIGAVIFNGYHLGLEALLKQADMAMYQAKKDGRNLLRFFDPEMQHAINLRVQMERELSRAIQLEQFQLHYQIQVNSAGKALGAEALISWIHPQRGVVAPENFMTVVEETGLILPIGQWVLDNACAQLKLWQQDSLTSELVLAVNISVKQFNQADFVAKVRASLQYHAIDPSKLKLELTERVLVANTEDIVLKMNALHAMGVSLALDDFGTGYLSLQDLTKLPLKQLKIARSFVRDIAVDDRDRLAVRTIVNMARSLNMDVIAEGVETAEQRQLLLQESCLHYQGYLFSKPVPIAEFSSLLRSL